MSSSCSSFSLMRLNIREGVSIATAISDEDTLSSTERDLRRQSPVGQCGWFRFTARRGVSTLEQCNVISHMIVVSSRASAHVILKSKQQTRRGATAFLTTTSPGCDSLAGRLEITFDFDFIQGLATCLHPFIINLNRKEQSQRSHLTAQASQFSISRKQLFLQTTSKRMTLTSCCLIHQMIRVRPSLPFSHTFSVCLLRCRI